MDGLEPTDLEPIVPCIELCKQIPAGKFADSLLVYFGFPKVYDPPPVHEELIVVPRAELGCVCQVMLKDGRRVAYPAPTLVEIMREGGPRMEYEIADMLLMGSEHADTITNTAMEAWLDIQKEQKGKADSTVKGCVNQAMQFCAEFSQHAEKEELELSKLRREAYEGISQAYSGLAGGLEKIAEDLRKEK